MVKLGVIGSRTITNYDFIKNILCNYINQNNINVDTIISGGAKGVDTCAEIFADQFGLDKIIFKPVDYNLYGNAAYAIRNQKIVDNSDILVAFQENNSTGTEMTMNMAKRKGIPIFLIKLDGEIYSLINL